MLSLQSDGKLVAAGYSHDWNKADMFALVRYHPDGSLDASFGDSGKVLTDIGPANDTATSAVIQPDGRIVVAWYTTIVDPSHQTLAEVGKLAENAKAVEQVPAEVELKAEPEAAAHQSEEPRA